MHPGKSRVSLPLSAAPSPIGEARKKRWRHHEFIAPPDTATTPLLHCPHSRHKAKHTPHFVLTTCTNDRSRIVHISVNQLVPIPSPAVGNATPPSAGSSGPAQTYDSTPLALLVLHMLTMPLPLDSRCEDTIRCPKTVPYNTTALLRPRGRRLSRQECRVQRDFITDVKAEQ